MIAAMGMLAPQTVKKASRKDQRKRYVNFWPRGKSFMRTRGKRSRLFQRGSVVW